MYEVTANNTIVGYAFADMPGSVVDPRVKESAIHEVWVFKPDADISRGFEVKRISAGVGPCSQAYKDNYALIVAKRMSGFTKQIVLADPSYCIDELKPKSP